MTKLYHSKGKLELGGCSGRMLIDSAGFTVADVDLLANAQRLHDCWNACAGIENPEDIKYVTEDLRTEMKDIALALGRSKTDGESDCDWHGMSDDVEDLRRQRDGLKEALEGIATIAKAKGWGKEDAGMAPRLALAASEAILDKFKVTP